MGFIEDITDKGYSLIQRTNEAVHIRNDEDAKVSIVVLMDLKDKTLMGCLKMNDLICSLNDVSHVYTIYRKMLEDLKFFQSKTRYDIINN